MAAEYDITVDGVAITVSVIARRADTGRPVEVPQQVAAAAAYALGWTSTGKAWKLCRRIWGRRDRIA